MPISAKLSAEGVWAWIAQNGAAVRMERVNAAMRRSQKQALTEWARDLKGGDVGLALRFQPEAFGVLGLTERGDKYQKRQRRTLGGIYPYVAPLSRGGEPSGKMRRAVLGGGYSITNKNNGGGVVTTQLAITGARILNRLPDPYRSIYTREFLGLDRGGRRDAVWITNRANELTKQALFKELTGARRVWLNGQAAEQNGASEGAA